ncbi:MAG: DNA-binding protein [Lachnospiraceae bacterium]|nr:DNA-binding protein [Lachnospiraceae bacterium]
MKTLTIKNVDKDIVMSENKKEHTIEERMELSLLYDFYGALLKENQRRMFEASILEDYNYAEIAEDEGITRQGVYDAVKRASKLLRDYEEKLGLVARFEEQKNLIKLLKSELLQMIQPEEENTNKIFEILDKLLEE